MKFTIEINNHTVKLEKYLQDHTLVHPKAQGRVAC